MYYPALVGDRDWTYPGESMRHRHGVEAEWADGALQDPDALRIAPELSSRSGRSVRTIGHYPSTGCLPTVITVTGGAVTYGVNGWRSDGTDIGRYREDLP